MILTLTNLRGMESPTLSELHQLRYEAVLRDDQTAYAFETGLHGCAAKLFQRLIETHDYSPEDALMAISNELMDAQDILSGVVFE